MLLLWLSMYALAVSPELHHLIHQDRQDPSHNCVVTQLQHHQVLPGLVATAIPAPPVAWRPAASAGEGQFLPSYDYRLSPSRAPPGA